MQEKSRPQLRRIVALPLLVAYGVGTILGAGVYVLIGKIANIAGVHAPYAFLLAAAVASLVGLSYAELSSRFPKSAGEAYFIHQAFGQRWLTLITGVAIIATGVVSAGVMARGFHGYLSEFASVPFRIAIPGFVLALVLTATWGILESAGVAALVTCIEIGGILLLLWVTRAPLTDYMLDFASYAPPADAKVWLTISFAAFIAFFAYIGFEDMINIAEEVIEPKRNMPRAILVSIAATTIIYLLVTAASVAALPVEILSASEAPFADILRSRSAIPSGVISGISLIAIFNGALVQLIMGSRVLYGLAAQGQLPRIFAWILPKTRIPLVATLAVGTVIAAFALWLPLETLAKITSFIILAVFTVVCFSLLVIKIKTPDHTGFTVHAVIPTLAGLCCTLFILIQFW